MNQRLLLFVKISSILLFSLPLTSPELHNSDDHEIKKHHTMIGKEVGYDFLHAYRTTLRNGLRGITTGKDVSPQCFLDLAKLSMDKELRMQYIDAVGKPRSGLLRGNIWLGSYAECRDISNAHYCTAQIKISFPKTTISAKLPYIGALWGLCFPKGCTGKDVSVTLKGILQQVEKALNHTILVEYSHVLCPAVKPSYTTGVKVTFALCGFLILLCLIGTIVDYLDETFSISSLPKSIEDVAKHENTISMVNASFPNQAMDVNGLDPTNSLTAEDVILLNRSASFPIKVHYIISTFKACCIGRFFQCFSLLHNTSKILKTDVPPTAIKTINGMRVISITWVILGHTFGNANSPILDNKAQVVEDSRLLSMMAILSGTYSVDTFFFLSGLLVAYTCFRKLKNSDGKFNWGLFYIHRFWRLTPSYMFVILFSVYLKGFLTESPLWHLQFTDPVCSKYWWTNLLYINNFYPTNGKECIGWSWYLANDMQFFIITPALILPLFKLGWRGLVMPIGLLLEAFAITAFIHANWDIDPLGFYKTYKWLDPAMKANMQKYMQYVYIKPYCRIQTYLVGFLLGYVMHRYSNTRARTPGWITTLLGWSVAAVVGMLLVYGPHKITLPDSEEWNKAENVIYGTFHRFLWSLVLAWVTYACHYGAGGLVQKFLSARFWIPLSRLTYNVYLIHIIILILMFYGAEATIHFDIYTVTYYFLAAVMLSYGAAYALSVVIEFPCANLEELILSYIRRRKRGD